MIVKCDCANEWMDKRYGKGRRVANKTSKAQPTYRCTVCLKEHTLNG